MKDKQVFEIINKMQYLDTTDLEKIDKAIDACLIVQVLTKAKKELNIL